MAFGKRIKFFRNRKGMKQKELGELLGFLGKTSDVRVAQYETEARTPKADLVKEMAQILGVSTRAINVPNIDSYLSLMHTLFALEDMYGIMTRVGLHCAPVAHQMLGTYPQGTVRFAFSTWNTQEEIDACIRAFHDMGIQ